MNRTLLRLLGLHSRVLRAHSLLPAAVGSSMALPPAIVQLELTHRCNLNCPMCYQSRNTGAAGELDAAAWKALMDQLPRWALLTLTGGDPFVRKDFSEILDHALKRNRCNILTNGELMTRGQIERMVAGKLALIGVSIDGTPATHDAIRRKPGLFARVRENLRLLAEEKRRRGARLPLVDIKTVILPENMEELAEVQRLAGELGADYWSLSLPKISPFQFSNLYRDDHEEVFRSRPEPTFLKPDAAARARLLERIEAVRASAAGPVVRFYPYNMLSARAVAAHLDNALQPGDFSACRIPWSFACVSPKGDVFPCLACRMGSVKEQPFSRIWNGGRFRAFRARLSRSGLNRFCLGCCYSVYKAS
jgi:MoaA/NifB/PqqE/SkfB family radical SAM enzyme